MATFGICFPPDRCTQVTRTHTQERVFARHVLSGVRHIDHVLIVQSRRGKVCSANLFIEH